MRTGRYCQCVVSCPGEIQVAHAFAVHVSGVPPFGRVELVEAAWWHPMRSRDPALRWLRSILRLAAPG